MTLRSLGRLPVSCLLSIVWWRCLLFMVYIWDLPSVCCTVGHPLRPCLSLLAVLLGVFPWFMTASLRLGPWSRMTLILLATGFFAGSAIRILVSSRCWVATF